MAADNEIRYLITYTHIRDILSKHRVLVYDERHAPIFTASFLDIVSLTLCLFGYEFSDVYDHELLEYAVDDISTNLPLITMFNELLDYIVHGQHVTCNTVNVCNWGDNIMVMEGTI